MADFEVVPREERPGAWLDAVRGGHTVFIPQWAVARPQNCAPRVRSYGDLRTHRTKRDAVEGHIVWLEPRS